MRSVYEARVAEANETQRRLRQHPDEIVSVCDFRKVAKALWPLNTAAELAAIAGKDERSGARWLSGEHEPPGIIIAAIVLRITNRGNGWGKDERTVSTARGAQGAARANGGD